MIDLYSLNNHFEEHEIKVPRHFHFDGALHTPHDIFRVVPPPWLVRLMEESGLQYFRVATFPELSTLLANSDNAHVEEVVEGDTYCVGIIKNYRGVDLYSLPVLENKYGRLLRTPHLDEILKTRMTATAKKLFITYNTSFGLLVYFMVCNNDLYIFDVEKFEENIVPQFLEA